MYLAIDTNALGVSRDKILEALIAEGVPGLSKTFENLHLLPMYQKKIAYGNEGFPWKSSICTRDVSYEKGICPVAESLHDTFYLGFQMCLHRMTDIEVDLMIGAFEKVWSKLDELV